VGHRHRRRRQRRRGRRRQADLRLGRDVELTHALEERLPVADVENIAGQFVSPTPRAVTAAAEDMAVASVGDFALSLLHTTGRSASPISSYTYLIVFARQDDPAKGRILADLLTGNARRFEPPRGSVPSGGVRP
jgi:hypothetical protein